MIGCGLVFIHCFTIFLLNTYTKNTLIIYDDVQSVQTYRRDEKKNHVVTETHGVTDTLNERKKVRVKRNEHFLFVIAMRHRKIKGYII